MFVKIYKSGKKGLKCYWQVVSLFFQSFIQTVFWLKRKPLYSYKGFFIWKLRVNDFIFAQMKKVSIQLLPLHLQPRLGQLCYVHDVDFR